MWNFLKKYFSKEKPNERIIEYHWKPDTKTFTVREMPADYAEIITYVDWLDDNFCEDDGMGFFIDKEGFEVAKEDIFKGNPNGYKKVAWYSR
jgi:hypothetical protein